MKNIGFVMLFPAFILQNSPRRVIFFTAELEI
jgi:hypothetical protein